MQLQICKKVKSFNLDEDDFVLLMCFCHLAGNNFDDNIGIHDLAFLYEDRSALIELKQSLSKGYHTLISNNQIAYNNDDGFMNLESWKLSDKARKELLSEIADRQNTNYSKGLIQFDSIKPRRMFYNSRETGEIQRLTSLLADDNYRKIQDRLDGKGMRKGFACIFSGVPGTGKTETAYQIARETKRSIMKVDVSETKSCWYGESEKRIKALFDAYRAAVDNSGTAPILLLNEADALIGKRKEFVYGSRAVDQTNNTLQNISQEEMETLSGILIATTNLTQNMDSAFERRFLYKITFDKPGSEIRTEIWKSLMPELDEDKAAALAAAFELSGGQIENIARKAEADSIINGAGLSMETLLRYCRDESQNSFSGTKRIGF